MRSRIILFLLCLILLTGCAPGASFPTETAAFSVPTETLLPTEETVSKSLSAADFVRDGEFMTCLTAPYLTGVDVSKYQSQIDWQAVAAAGIDFVMIRIGGRGYGQSGSLYADEMAQTHYAGAKAVGLQVGAYFFSQAISEDEAREEGAYALELVRDWDLDLPIAYDWEYLSDTARTAQTTPQTVTACAAAFCDTVLTSGCPAMIYVRPEQSYLDPTVLTAYPHWIAHYGDTMEKPFTMWQYTNTGTVPGITGDVDINLYLPEE